MLIQERKGDLEKDILVSKVNPVEKIEVEDTPVRSKSEISHRKGKDKTDRWLWCECGADDKEQSKINHFQLEQYPLPRLEKN